MLKISFIVINTHIYTQRGFQQLFAFDIKQASTFMNEFPNT